MYVLDVSLNRLAVLKAIRGNGPIARTELQERTGLASATITQVTGELLKRGLIVEKKDSTKRKGRPRVFLEIAADGGIVIGASVTGRNALSATFVDLAGNLRFETEVPSGDPRSYEDLATTLTAALESAIAASGISRREIIRVGIALPALVNTVHGIIYFMTTYPTGPFALAESISGRVGIPVTLEHEMSCKARFEHWFGRARQLSSFSLLDVGLALGSAQYVSGLPRGGAHGIGPELGHTKTDTGPHARPCYCGSSGCANAYASIYSLLLAGGRMAAQIPPADDLHGRFAQFLSDAEMGAPEPLALLAEAGAHLGLAVANHVNAADPGHVLVLVPDRRFEEYAAEAFERALKQNVLPGLLPLTRIEMTSSSPEWRSKGTAALALEQSYLSGTVIRRSRDRVVNERD